MIMSHVFSTEAVCFVELLKVCENIIKMHLKIEISRIKGLALPGKSNIKKEHFGH